VRCTTLCNKVCQLLATGRWFSPGPPVSSTNKTDRHDITKILLKVVLNTIKQTNRLCLGLSYSIILLILLLTYILIAQRHELQKRHKELLHACQTKPHNLPMVEIQIEREKEVKTDNYI
jgi:hypothetical protein